MLVRSIKSETLNRFQEPDVWKPLIIINVTFILQVVTIFCKAPFMFIIIIIIVITLINNTTMIIKFFEEGTFLT